MSSNARVHWIGAGLSSVPGIRRLAATGKPFVLWNRTVEKARQALAGVNAPQAEVREWTDGALDSVLKKGEIVVSMLPADRHVEIAKLCLAKGAHLVTTSYLSPAMRAMDADVKAAGLSFVNECGLDPGLDHLLAHELVERFTTSKACAQADAVEFESHCGGFPEKPHAFTYKFSWSPLGVLRALKNTARYQKNGDVVTCERPWDHLTEHATKRGTFEVYPNRDSMPYLAEYGIPSQWPMTNFMRGTLRPKGWKTAWSSILAALPTMPAPELEALSQNLAREHAYGPGEKDRVVLSVGLRASAKGKQIWNESFLLDHTGTGQESAMAQLVSHPAVLAVEEIREGTLKPGVQGLPAEGELRRRWLDTLKPYGLTMDSKI